MPHCIKNLEAPAKPQKFLIFSLSLALLLRISKESRFLIVVEVTPSSFYVCGTFKKKSSLCIFFKIFLARKTNTVAFKLNRHYIGF